jgi:hypothetical protein
VILIGILAGSGAGGFTGGTEVAVAHETTPFVTAYPWTLVSGFGTKYANPAALPSGGAQSVAFAPGGAQVAVGSTAGGGNPFVSAYPWAPGFGTRYAAAANPPNSIAYGTAFTPNGAQIGFATQSTPFVHTYPWSSSGFGTKYANPATLPLGTNALSVTFSPDNATIGVGTTQPDLAFYPWAPGFGTRYANPATMPPDQVTTVRFSPNGGQIAVSHRGPTGGPYISVYPWSSSGFGTRYANPTYVTGTARGFTADFSPNSSQIALGGLNSTAGTHTLQAWPWAPGFGTRYADPAVAPDGAVNGVRFHPSGLAVAVANGGITRRTDAWAWSSSGFGTKYANAPTQPAGSGNGIAFS